MPVSYIGAESPALTLQMGFLNLLTLLLHQEADRVNFIGISQWEPWAEIGKAGILTHPAPSCWTVLAKTAVFCQRPERWFGALSVTYSSHVLVTSPSLRAL